MNDTAIMLFSYGSTVLDMSLSSITKYCPGYDIYLIDTVEYTRSKHKGKNWRPYLKQWITDCLDKYHGRVTRLEWVGKNEVSAMTGTPKFLRFAASYPQYKYFLKLDDDTFLTDYGLVDGLKEGLGLDNVFVAAGIAPYAIHMPQIITNKTGIIFSDDLRSGKLPERVLANPELLYELWDKTFPPDKLLSKLRDNPDKYVFPICGVSKNWSCNNFLIRTKDIPPVFNICNDDEKSLNKYHRLGHRICINTHHLVYHHSYRGMKEWMDKNITPIIRAHDFWRIDG